MVLNKVLIIILFHFWKGSVFNTVDSWKLYKSVPQCTERDTERKRAEVMMTDSHLPEEADNTAPAWYERHRILPPAGIWQSSLLDDWKSPPCSPRCRWCYSFQQFVHTWKGRKQWSKSNISSSCSASYAILTLCLHNSTNPEQLTGLQSVLHHNVQSGLSERCTSVDCFTVSVVHCSLKKCCTV